MGMDPIFNYKTPKTGETPPAPKPGKANIAGASGTSSTDSYMDNLKAEGKKKQGLPGDPTESESGDPVADLINTLDKISNEGVPQGNMVPFGKVSALDVISKNPDQLPEILTKFNSVVTIIEKKIGDLDKGLASGTGTPQQVQVAQQLKAQLEDLLSFYKIQRDTVAEIIPQKEKFWADELKNFLENGGKGDPRDFDLDDDGWIGKRSFHIGTRTFDKTYIDPTAQKLYEAGNKDIQYKFKKGDIQYWAINPETEKRVQFAANGKVVGEQTAAPGYVANMGKGFAGNNPNVVPNDKGIIELKAQQLSNAQNFAEAGLELITPEHIYVKMTDGEVDLDDQGRMQPLGFELKDGQLVQKIPTGDDVGKYGQVYVKKMDVRTDDGNIVVDLRGGDDNSKILRMVITGPDGNKASDVALAITSGDPKGPSHRTSAIILDTGSYESTSKVGIKDPKKFYDKFTYEGNKATGPGAEQINDTLKHFVDKGDGNIDSALERGIAFRTHGQIIGTGGSDLLWAEPPESHLTPKDGAYTTVFEGGAGHNAVFMTEGSFFGTGLTAFDKVSKANDEVSIGINAYGEKKDDKGVIKSTKGESYTSSNKLYIHVDTPESALVAIQSAIDGKFDASQDPDKNIVEALFASDDYYDVKAKVVATNLFDATTNQSFDTDLQKKNGKTPIQGKLTSAATGDFLASGEQFNKHVKDLVDSITKKATEKDEDWKIDGTTQAWMQGKHYKADKNTLEQFFADFSASKVNSIDPFKQLDEGMKQAEGEE